MENTPQKEDTPKYPFCRCMNYLKGVCFFCEDTATEELEDTHEENKKDSDLVDKKEG